VPAAQTERSTLLKLLTRRLVQSLTVVSEDGESVQALYSAAAVAVQDGSAAAVLQAAAQVTLQAAVAVQVSYQLEQFTTTA
jgi:hypothetical protein